MKLKTIQCAADLATCVKENYDFDSFTIINQQQAEINRLREALSFYATQKTMTKSVHNGKPCRMIYCCADVAEEALNGESEEKNVRKI